MLRLDPCIFRALRVQGFDCVFQLANTRLLLFQHPITLQSVLLALRKYDQNVVVVLQRLLLASLDRLDLLFLHLDLPFQRTDL